MTDIQNIVLKDGHQSTPIIFAKKNNCKEFYLNKKILQLAD